jgi:thiamine-phosphate pyrophosphorylase
MEECIFAPRLIWLDPSRPAPYGQTVNRENSGREGAHLACSRGLYAIADADAAAARGLDWVLCAQAMLAAEVPLLQLRAKGMGAGKMLEALRTVQLGRGSKKTFLVQNDRADVADLVGVEAVHVGQDDLSIDDLKRLYPHLRSGLSTHSIEQLSAALETNSLEPGHLSYLALGPVFQTGSKRNAEPEVGIDALKQAYPLCLAARMPLVAIGGIGLDEIEEVAPHADFIAAISLLLPPSGAVNPYQWIEERCREIQQLILAVPLARPG